MSVIKKIGPVNNKPAGTPNIIPKSVLVEPTKMGLIPFRISYSNNKHTQNNLRVLLLQKRHSEYQYLY